MKSNTASRFHGAFTGGFSAGYYNTVGSEEGFKPKSFVSSRSNRATREGTKVSDYMDSDDGILGGTLESRKVYDTFDDKSKALSQQIASHILSAPSSSSSSASIIVPGPIPSELIVNTSHSIGKKLLATMGWKEGHSIGSKRIYTPLSYTTSNNMTLSAKSDMLIIRDTVDPKSSIKSSNDVTTSTHINSSNKSIKSLSDTYSVPSREIYTSVIPTIKSDVYGLGFTNISQLDSNVMSNSSISSGSKRKRTIKEMLESSTQDGIFNHKGGKVRITSGSVRLNVYNDDEEDNIYDDVEIVDDCEDQPLVKSNQIQQQSVYEIDIDEDRGIFDNYNQSSITRKYPPNDRNLSSNVSLTDNFTSTSPSICPTDGKPVLSGFILSSTESARETLPRFPALIVPRDFKGYHTFRNTEKSSDSTKDTVISIREGDLSKESQLKAQLLERRHQRKHLLSGTNVDMKIDDKTISSSELRASILGEKEILHSTTTPQIESDKDQDKDKSIERPYLTSESLLKSTFSGLSAAFKNRFVSASNSSDTTPPPTTNPAEKASETSISNAATGTTSSTGINVHYNNDIHPSLIGLKTAQEHANIKSIHIQNKVGTSSTMSDTPMMTSRDMKVTVPMHHPRISHVWIPHPLLCKRFNVPVPDISTASSYLATKMSSKQLPSISSSSSSMTTALPTTFGPLSTQTKTTTISSLIEGNYIEDHSINPVSREDEMYQANIGKYLTPSTTTATTTTTKASSTSIHSQVDSIKKVIDDNDTKTILTDIYQHNLPKPAISLFHSIFADSSDEDDDEEEEEEESDHEETSIDENNLNSKNIFNETVMQSEVVSTTVPSTLYTTSPIPNNTNISSTAPCTDMLPPTKILYRKLPSKLIKTDTNEDTTSSNIINTSSDNVKDKSSIFKKRVSKSNDIMKKTLLSFEEDADGDDNDNDLKAYHLKKKASATMEIIPISTPIISQKIHTLIPIDKMNSGRQIYGDITVREASSLIGESEGDNSEDMIIKDDNDVKSFLLKMAYKSSSTVMTTTSSSQHKIDTIATIDTSHLKSDLKKNTNVVSSSKTSIISNKQEDNDDVSDSNSSSGSSNNSNDNSRNEKQNSINMSSAMMAVDPKNISSSIQLLSHALIDKLPDKDRKKKDKKKSKDEKKKKKKKKKDSRAKKKHHKRDKKV